MKSYNVCVEFMAFVEVEAETKEEAETKATEIMRSQGGIVEWMATAYNGREISE